MWETPGIEPVTSGLTSVYQIWAGAGSGTGRFGRYRNFFSSCCIICFMMSYLHHVPLQFPRWITCTPPVPRLYHVLPSSSKTASCAILQFPGCITCVVLLSSSQTVSRATLEFTECIMPPPPLVTLGEENYLYFHRLVLLLI